ncbi:MAG: transposase [Thermoplasmata archaeon]|nr:transposase [Thermoplasmata archaeon]MCJ7561984.1 transposase [Thermoplasmata archaeon]
MEATDVIIPEQVFKFTGQTKVDTYLIDLNSLLIEQRMYDEVMINKVRLAFEAIRSYADNFPFWQRHRWTGRPPTEERTLLSAFLVRQLFDLTFRETEGLLRMLADYFRMDRVPDHSVLCRKNASLRWLTLWKRFQDFVVSSLPKRSPVIATDASGFSGRKRSWRETDHGLKATQDWVKIHAAIEVDQFFVLSYCLTESKVHDSQMFPEVWDGLPQNVSPKRSLADSAYFGNDCLVAARQHGATPLHGIKKNARHFSKPETLYQKMASFWQHWPNRAAALYGKRNHAETAFSMIGRLFGYRIRCRSKTGRKNEVNAKISMFNLLLLARKTISLQN